MVETIIVVLGNIFLPFLVLSILVMLIVELISALFQLRGRVLRKFISAMLRHDPDAPEIGEEVYKHRLVASLVPVGKLPPYIPSSIFCVALLDCMASNRTSGSANVADTVGSKNTRSDIDAIIQHSSGRDPGAIRIWYNAAMDGASGSYRQLTMLLILFVAICIVLPINFDAIRIADHVSKQSLIEKAFEVQLKIASENVNKSGDTVPELSEALKQSEFPLGWDGDHPRDSTDLRRWLILKVSGILTSVLAITLTAPFLFDILNRFMVVRSAFRPFESAVEIGSERD